MVSHKAFITYMNTCLVKTSSIQNVDSALALSISYEGLLGLYHEKITSKVSIRDQDFNGVLVQR